MLKGNEDIFILIIYLVFIKKYNIDNPSVEYQGERFFLFNNEVLLKETRILQKDKLNRRTFKNEFIVVGYKEWFKQRDLYIFYSLMFVMSLTSGAYIFLEKRLFFNFK